MTKKDYIALAAALKIARGQRAVDTENDSDAAVWNYTVECTAEHIADVLQADNPRFDRSRFLNACSD